MASYGEEPVKAADGITQEAGPAIALDAGLNCSPTASSSYLNCGGRIPSPPIGARSRILSQNICGEGVSR